MSPTPAAHFEADLRLSPAPAIAGLAAAGILLALAGGNAAHVVPTQPVALALLAIALGAWLLDRVKPGLGTWVVVIAPAVVIQAASVWLNLSLAPLAVLPVALAATLIGLRWAALVAGGEVLLIGLSTWLALPGTQGDGLAMAVTLIGSVLALLWGLDRRVQNVARWSWEHYRLARETLDEAYTYRAQHEQLLDDLVHANRQLALVNEKLTAARIAAEEAQRAKAAFVANVSHEFRTPLNMIIGLTDLLLETPEVYGQTLPPPLLEDLEIVCRNCEHLSALINDVLDLSQIEAGQLAVHRERVALPEVIDRALTIVRPLIEKKGLALAIEISPSLPEVYCDRTRIRQVVLNLLSNAARLTEQGQITVRVEQQGEFVVVSVADTGPGIAPEDVRRIFQPFYRGTGRASLEAGGSGLGLSVSREFVELHGGQMWLESAVGIGSTFYFRLPLLTPEVHAGGAQAKNVEDWVWHERVASSTVPRQPLTRRILIYDEAGDLRSLCARYWDEVEFVAGADPAQSALEVQRCAAEAILLNTISPGLLHAQLEQVRLAVPDLPIIGCSLPARADQAAAAGANGYLLKPALRASLLEAIAQLGRPVRRILLVDDNADARQLYTRMLGSGTLDIVPASSGREALEKLTECRPDLMILDIVLPDMDGWQVLAAKRQDERVRDIPVIILTAQDPAERPAATPVLAVAMGHDLAFGKLIRCSQALLAVLKQPE